MSDAILVLNAGSSSIKFSVFLERGAALDLFLGGQLEGLYTAPRFKARDAAGAPAAERPPYRPARSPQDIPHPQDGADQRIGGAYCRPPWVQSAFLPRGMPSGEPAPTLRSKISP